MLSKVRKQLKELGHLTPVALLVTFLPIVGSSLLLIFLVPIGYWLRENWEIGMAVFLGGMLFFCGLALLPTNVIGIVGGWAFGFGLGLPILMCGVVGASVIGFVVNRRISGERLPAALEKHPRSAAIYRSLLKEDVKRTTLIIALVRMSVIMPFAFTNFLMAASRVPLPAYIIGTAVGMLPRSGAMVFVGAGVAELNVANTQETYLFFMGVISSAILIMALAWFSRKALEKLTRNQGSVSV